MIPALNVKEAVIRKAGVSGVNMSQVWYKRCPLQGRNSKLDVLLVYHAGEMGTLLCGMDRGTLILRCGIDGQMGDTDT